jgi:O-antigen ligase
MPLHRRRLGDLSPSLPFALLLTLLAMLWLAGGASRADVMGQAVVRGGAALALVVLALFGRRPSLGSATPVLVLLLASAALVLLQLVPLPPGLWQALPGRTVFLPGVQNEALWRPLATAPDAAVNAAASLLVPFAVLILALGLLSAERERLPLAALALIFLSMLVGLLQFSGSHIGNMFINDTPGAVSGSFANPNHFALFMAFGCVVAPAWAALGDPRRQWRWLVALGLIILFELLILASGSRTGMLLGALAFAMGALLAARPIRSALRRSPRWVLPSLVVVVIAIVGAIVLASIAADRAASIDRALVGDVQADMRVRALPTVLSMAWDYFPFGSGFGGFDTVFRLHEPFDLLKPTYFNHAHSDFIEIVIDGGAPALLLLMVAIGWWLVATIRVWRNPPSARVTLGRLGSGMLMLTFVGSVVDYPARTPTIMAMIVIAALWLGWGAAKSSKGSALPRNDQLL